MKVLALDTAGPVIGVALWVDGSLRERTERIARGAEARLVPWAQELVAEAGVPLSALDGVAVTEGPGAFTGLRVGLATALGLAIGLGCPVWTTSSLLPRARRAADDRVLALLDARKGRVYGQWFASPGHGPGDVPPEEAVAWARPPFVATGEGALVYRAQVEAAGGAIAAEADHPAVDVLARLAAEGLRRGEGADPLTVRPVYLRAPDAKPPAPR